MPSRIPAAFVSLLILIPGLAAAQTGMYKCVDAKGKTYYTQVPPKECLGRATEELSRGGQVIRRNEVITPEQRAAAEEEKKKKAELEQRDRAETRKNMALLNTYSSEKEVEDTRARALKENEAAIKDIENKIAGAMKTRKNFESEKEFYKNKPLPPKLQDDIRNNDSVINSQQQLLEAKKKEVIHINARYDEDKKRYVELTKGSGGSVPQVSGRK